MTMQVFDYTTADYIVACFKSTGNGAEYLLAGSFVGATYAATINGVSTTVSNINSTAVQIAFNSAGLPTAGNSTIQLVLSNLANPPFVSDLWLQISTHDQATGGIKEILTSSSLAITASALTFTVPSVLLLSNNSVSLVLSNANRNLLSHNSSSSLTDLSISIPSELSCSLANTSIPISWLVGVTTSGTTTSGATYSGNTTQLTINLGTCLVSYFSTSPAISVA